MKNANERKIRLFEGAKKKPIKSCAASLMAFRRVGEKMEHNFK